MLYYSGFSFISPAPASANIANMRTMVDTDNDHTSSQSITGSDEDAIPESNQPKRKSYRIGSEFKRKKVKQCNSYS